MLISEAYAQTASGGGGVASIMQGPLPMIVMIAGIFYFLVVRPQQQSAKQLKAVQAGIRRGDRIVTAGGVLGTVSRIINDDEIEVQITDGVKIRVLRNTVPTVLAKTEPTSPADKIAKAKEKQTEEETTGE